MYARENVSAHSLDAETKVELPCANVRRRVALLIAQCDAELDELEQIDVTPQCLVVIIAGPLECTDWSSDDAWELGVLQIEHTE